MLLIYNTKDNVYRPSALPCARFELTTPKSVWIEAEQQMKTLKYTENTIVDFL